MEIDILTRNLGLTEKEARVYLAILELGDATVFPISKKSGVKRTSIYYFIDHLVELGLIDHAEIRGRMHYTAKPPESVIALQERRLADLREGLPELLSHYNVLTRKPKIRYYEGAEQMKHIIEEETRCQRELLVAWDAQEVSEIFGKEYLFEVDRRRVEAGIHLRTLRAATGDDVFSAYRGGPGQLRELRYAPVNTNLPIGTLIFDTGKVGFISSKEEGFGVLIESPQVMLTLRTFFEALWERSRPATTANRRMRS